MSTTTLSIVKDEPGLVSEVSREEQGFLASDTPLGVYQALYPNDSKPEESVNCFMLRTLAPYVKDVHGAPLDELIQQTGLSKHDVDILCISAIEYQHEFDKNAQQMLEGSIYVNAKFISKDPYKISDRDLYRNMHISR